ncbi:MAG TPA: MFS transporter [Candidatus Bathyarchaeota archaeon]|nr:MFS transporter [Candidatus Bathyarchaeota archaeon]
MRFKVEMKREFITVFGTHMFVEVFLFVHLALIPTFIKEFNLNLFQASLIATIPNLVVLLSYMPAGLLVDKIGAKPMLLISMLLEGTAALCISQLRDYLPLILAVSLIKVSSPIYHTSGLSAISKMSTSNSTGKVMGFHNALGSLGSAFGLLSLSILGGTLGWRSVYLLWSIPILMWCLPILKSEVGKPERSPDKDRGEKTFFRDLKSVLTFSFALFLLIVALRNFGASVISTFMTTYLVELRNFSQEDASMIFALGPLTGILSSLVSGYLCSKLGDTETLLLMVVGSILSLFPLALTRGLALLMLCYFVYSFFNNGVWSPIGSLVAALTPSSKRGLGYSSYFLIGGVASTIQPTITAIIIGYTSLNAIFPIAIGILTACAALLTLFYHGFKPY